MNPLEFSYSAQNHQNLIAEYKDNIALALHNIQKVIDLLEQSDAQLDQKIAFAQETINSTVDKFQKLDKKILVLRSRESGVKTQK